MLQTPQTKLVREKLFVILLFLFLFVSQLAVPSVDAASVVGASANLDATYMPFQRKAFYANGRFWVFYSDGANMVFSTSTDGVTWSSSTAVRASDFGYHFSIWFDGTYLHYAYAWGSPIYYRRGTPNANGTITWSSAEQTVATTYNTAYYPMVSVDSDGYVWVAYVDFNGTYYYPFVIKSGNNDGTWGATPSDFPHRLSTIYTDDAWRVSVVPLTNAKMFVVYAYNLEVVRAKSWNGSAWGAEVATTNFISFAEYHSVVAQGDDAHIVFLEDPTCDILYVKYAYSTNNFTSAVTVQTEAAGTSAPVLSINTANNLYCFWAGSPTVNHIYYKKCVDGVWDAQSVDWIDESTEVLTSEDMLTCFYKDYGDKIGLVYMTKTLSPYNVKFDYLMISTPPSIGGFQAPTGRIDVGEYFLLNATINDPDGTAGFVNATVELNGTVILKWDNATDAFTEHSDPNNYCTLDAPNSFRETLNSTAYKLSWKVKFSVVAAWSVTDGNTKVYDSDGLSGSGSQEALFVTDKLNVTFASAPEQPQAGDTITLSWTIKRQYDNSIVTDFVIDLSKDSAPWKSGLTCNSTTDTEWAEASHTYNASAVTDNTYGLTSFDSTALTVTWTGVPTPPSPPPVYFEAHSVSLGEVHAGSSTDFNITAEFSSHRVTINRVEFEEKAAWFKVWNTLPETFDKGQNITGKAILNAQLTTPPEAGATSYTTPFKIYATTPDGASIQSRAFMTFTVITPGTGIPTPEIPTPEEVIEAVKRLLGNPQMLILLIAGVAWLSYYSLKKR